MASSRLKARHGLRRGFDSVRAGGAFGAPARYDRARITHDPTDTGAAAGPPAPPALRRVLRVHPGRGVRADGRDRPGRRERARRLGVPVRARRAVRRRRGVARPGRRRGRGRGRATVPPVRPPPAERVRRRPRVRGLVEGGGRPRRLRRVTACANPRGRREKSAGLPVFSPRPLGLPHPPLPSSPSPRRAEACARRRAGDGGAVGRW